MEEKDKIIAELKAENERLKEKNQSLSILGIAFKSANEIVRKEFFRADKNKDMWREKAENLQKTLQEIKEICKETCRKRCTNDCLGTKKHCGYGQILQLITKAESEEV